MIDQSHTSTVRGWGDLYICTVCLNLAHTDLFAMILEQY